MEPVVILLIYLAGLVVSLVILYMLCRFATQAFVDGTAKRNEEMMKHLDTIMILLGAIETNSKYLKEPKQGSGASQPDLLGELQNMRILMEAVEKNTRHVNIE